MRYARAHVSGLPGAPLPEVQRLAGALAFAGRLERSPYADLAAPAQWAAIARDFCKQSCALVGQVRGGCAGERAWVVTGLARGRNRPKQRA